MIYPSHLKYDQSRRMPYLAMLDRLKTFSRPPTRGVGLGSPVLITCGYSFADDHLNEVLLDGLRGNPSAHCFALMYGDLSASERAVEYAERQSNLTVLAADGAVVGTRKGLYRPVATSSMDSGPWLAEEAPPVAGAGPHEPLARLRLGDFHYFGLFLEQLCGTTVQ